jgi:predicted transcriptional regulator
MSTKSPLQNVFGHESAKIFAYPQSDVREVARIMQDTKMDCIPVVFSPWNKKLVGFLELNKISVLLND